MKKNIQEEVTRIKKVMGMINEDNFGDVDPQPKNMSVEDAIDKLKMLSNHVEGVAQEFRDMFEGTEYWDYVRKMYSALRNVSDMEKFHTRTDQHGQNVSDVISSLKDSFGYESSVMNDDYDERLDREYGVEDDNEPLRDEI